MRFFVKFYVAKIAKYDVLFLSKVSLCMIKEAHFSQWCTEPEGLKLFSKIF